MKKTLPEGYILYNEHGFSITGIGGGSSGIYFKTIKNLSEGLAEITEALFVSRGIGCSFSFELYNAKGDFIKKINIKLKRKILIKIEKKKS